MLNTNCMKSSDKLVCYIIYIERERELPVSKDSCHLFDSSICSLPMGDLTSTVRDLFTEPVNGQGSVATIDEPGS